MRFMFVGERRSRWRDGGLAAVSLFQAIRESGFSTDDQEFENAYRDDTDGLTVNQSAIRRIRRAQKSGTPIVAMGRLASNALGAAGIQHSLIVHPAARGKIRRRDRYVAHVTAVLSSIQGS